jgi:hypothetical protein
VVPAAADVNVPVKPLLYQSVFADYTAVKQAPESPDKSWVRANCVVLGEEADAPASGKPPASGIPRDMASSDQVQGKHEHRGEHQ